MKKRKVVILIFIIAMCSIILCGCWNYREIDSLAIVAGMAIDKDMKTNQYTVTTEIVTAEEQGTTSKISSEIYSAEGDSVFSAVRNTIEKTGLRLFWSDAKVVIISEPLSKEGIIPVIDWTNRDSEPRSDMWVLIAKGKSAAEILENKVKLNGVVSFHLDDTMKSGEVLSRYTPSKLWSFIDGISSPEKSETIAVVKNEQIDGHISTRVSGCGVFKGDKLVGYLNESETQYMLMVKNKLKAGVITLKDVAGTDTTITLEIFRNKTKLTPLYKDGKLSLIIDIYAVVAIDEVGGSKDFMKEENLKTFQGEAEKKIEEQVQYLISKLQKDYESDVLGFEEVFAKEKPKISDNFKKSGEDIFENIKTEVNVHLKIKGSGGELKPISLGK